jgi:Arc/MetJ-type ribon-helix-helix transcriptional regulator
MTIERDDKVRLRDLCKDIIAGNVDDDTRAALKSATMRYVATQYDEPEQVLERLYHNSPLLRRAVAIVEEADREADDGDRENGDRNDGGGGSASDHHVSRIADLAVESGKFSSRSEALHHLMNTASGAALLHRVRTHKKDDPQMTSTSHAEFVSDVVKTYGIVALAKSMVQDQKSYGLDEPSFTRLATEHASRLYPNDRPDSAFSKLYQSEESVRRACQIVKAWPMPMSLEPMVATGAFGFPSTRMRSGSSPGRGDDSGDVDAVGVSDAYEQLTRLAEQQRRVGESASQAFERVYLDPANKHLAEAERMANRPQPTSYFPMPR